MKYEIKKRISCGGQVIVSADAKRLKELASAHKADLSGADLSGADLSGADLSGANLSGADLYGANLYGVKGIISFICGAALAVAFFFKGKTYLKIGCQCHAIAHWKVNYRKIGKANSYTKTQIDQYGAFIKIIKSLKQQQVKGKK